jgi:hypothetical protein
MKYMLLIYHDEEYWMSRTPVEMEPVRQLVSEYIQQLQSAGVLRSCGPLKSTATATTIRRRNGTVTITDGPFAESREQLGGYFLVEVPDLDTAIHWAQRWPNLDTASVEIRPMTELGAPN